MGIIQAVKGFIYSGECICIINGTYIYLVQINAEMQATIFLSN